MHLKLTLQPILLMEINLCFPVHPTLTPVAKTHKNQGQFLSQLQ